MHIKATVQNVHTITVPGRRRGPQTLTSVWVTDHHDHSERPSKQPPVLWEVQFLDTASRRWSEAIDQFLDTGQRVLVEIEDTFELVHVDRDPGSRTFIKARGIDIGASLIDAARQAADTA